MEQCLDSKARAAWQSPARPEDNVPPSAASRAVGSSAGVRQGPASPGVIRSALQYLAQALEDLETMLFPGPDLSSRGPRLPSAPAIRLASTPQVPHDRKGAVAADDVQRNAPLIRQAVNDWLQAQAPGAASTGARMFCEADPARWTALSAQLADLVVADCGPRLAQLAREVVTAAGTQIEIALTPVSEDEQQKILADVLARVIGQASPNGGAPLLSPALAGFLGQVRSDVQAWTSGHGSTGWQTVGLAGPNVVANILFACGLRAVVAQLSREAQSQPPTPSSRFIQGRGGAARASEATLYGWLQKMCLDVGHGQPLVLKDRYGIFTAASLGRKANQAVRRLVAAIPYKQDLTSLTPAPITPRLVQPGKPVLSPSQVHPQAVSSPAKPEEERTPSSRSASRHSDVSAEEFVTRGRHPAQEPDGQDD